MYLPRTLIVSDQPFHRDCLYALLSSFQTIELVDRTSLLECEYIEFIDKHIDVLVVDVNESSSMDEIRNLFQKFHKSRKLVITSNTNNWFLSALIHIGANGCFITTEKGSELAIAIRVIYSERWYLPEDLYNQLYCELDIKQQEIFSVVEEVIHPMDIHKVDFNSLTSRELEVLRLMAIGETSSSIAEKLFISDSTVSTHRKHILKKLGFNNTPTLIRYTLEQGLI